MAHLQRVTDEQVLSAYRETGSVWKAALRLGIRGGSLHERLQRMGFKTYHHRWDTEELAIAKQMTKDGFSISRIADRIGRTYAGTAAKLSELGEAHVYPHAQRIKRGTGLNKARVARFAKYLLASGFTVTRAARQRGITTTGLVSALQLHAPLLWEEYIRTHAVLPASICPGCGRAFVPLTKRQKACSTACSSHARSDNKYFGGRRRFAIGLMEGVCQLCERKKSGLAAHHVFGKENDPENEVLIALCSGCHQLVGILGRRSDTCQTSFWENLISLAVARSWADKGKRVLGTHIAVDIDELSPDDIAALEDNAVTVTKQYGAPELTQIVVSTVEQRAAQAGDGVGSASAL